jgi:MoxR-like ATPase
MTDLGYTPLFDPRLDTQPDISGRAVRVGDQAAQVEYVYSRRIVLAVNAALAAGRPLLLRGHPGTGKSSLAPDVARKLGWRYYASSVTSRTQARDLQWTFDAVARLADAQAGDTDRARQPEHYRRAGPLWWAFDPAFAARRGASIERLTELGITPDADRSTVSHERAVVLIDEIDKADPDVPNDLLLPLGSFRFRVDDVGVVEAKPAPLVVITTNEERDLPRAFLRRCIALTLRPPSEDRLKHIGRVHFPDDEAIVDDVAAAYLALVETHHDEGLHQPSAAEFLDAVAAVKVLKLPRPSSTWDIIEEVALAKRAPDLSPADRSTEYEEDDLT